MMKTKSLSKRIISVILSLSVLCSALLLQSFSAFAADVNLEGQGTKGAPYLIKNAEDLAYLVQKGGYLGNKTSTEGFETWNKYFELTNDIDLNDVSTEWYKDPTGVTGLNEWKNTGTFTKADGTSDTAVFHGHLNGNGHKIYGLYINDETATHGGLFAKINANASIENLGIEKSYIAVSMSNGNAGALVGERKEWNGNAAITNCYSSDTVTVKGKIAGGLVGNSYYKLTFTNSYSSAVLDGTTKGGIVGYGGYEYASDGTPYLTLNYCYSASDKVQLVGGFPARKKYKGCYATVATTSESGNGVVTALTVEQMTGEAAKDNMSNMYFPQKWFTREDDTPIPAAFVDRGEDTDAPTLGGELTVDGLSADTAALNWTEATDLFTTPEDMVYKVYKSTSAINDVNAAELIATSKANLSSIVTGLNGDDTYYFAVTATDEKGLTSAPIYSAAYKHSFSDRDTWDGETVATRFAVGDGSEGNPYRIATAAQLAHLMDICAQGTSATNGKYFVLLADIDLNDVSKDDWKIKWPNEWTYGTSTDKKTAFAGNFNGQGHIIRGLYIEETAKTYNGLFPGLASNATVKNLGISDSYIGSATTSKNYFGALAGAHILSTSGNGVTVDSCYVDSSVEVEGAYASGLIGTVSKALTVKNSYSKAAVTGENDSGMFIADIPAYNVPVTIEGCYNSVAGMPLVTENALSTPKYSNSYSAGESKPGLALLKLEQMTGDAAKENMRTFAFDDVWKVKENDTPILVAFSPVVLQIEVWSGEVADAADLSLKDTSNPTNSADNPYLIDSAEKLAYIARAGGSATEGKYYELTCDIYLNDVSDETWYDSAHTNTQWFDTNDQATIQFNGHLNGNGKIIYGIYINDSKRQTAGLFMGTKSSSASITNLGIEKSYINAKNQVGAIVGVKDNWASIDLSNCYSSDTVILKASGENVGGLIGFLNTQGGGGYHYTISNCYSNAAVSGSNKVGGLIGSNYSVNETTNISITNCYSTQSGRGLIGTVYNPVVLQQYGTFENNYSMAWVGRWVGVGSSDNKTFSDNRFKNGTGSAVSVAGMTGSVAKENMPGYDFAASPEEYAGENRKTWYVLEGKTPQLTIFNREVYDLTKPVFDEGKITETEVSQIAIAIKWPKAVDEQYTPSEFMQYTVYSSDAKITAANIGSLTSRGSFIGITEATVDGFSKGDKIYFAVAATDQSGNTSYLFADEPIETKPTEKGKVWSGKVATMFDAGDGTKNSPYEIASAEQLALAAKTAKELGWDGTKDKYYKLTADILLNNVSDKDWEKKNPTEWVWGTSDMQLSFSGNFNGEYHVVKGIYINESADCFAGLFPSVDAGAVIRNVGVVESHIIAFNESGEAWAGAITGFQRPWTTGDGVIIENCFSDETVTIEGGTYAGGIIGGIMCSSSSAIKVHITNCYSGANITASKTNLAGSIAGDMRFRDADDVVEVKGCYGMNFGKELVGNRSDRVDYVNCYNIGALHPGITKINFLDVIGKDADKYMKDFDFEGTWETVENGTPILKKFKNATYAVNRVPVTITFESSGGTEVEPKVGFVGDKLELPEITKEGYIFDGWCVYSSLDIKYPIDTFPAYDLTLFAKWIDPAAFRQNFESYAYLYEGEEGLGMDYEVYRPGVENYSADYVHGGGRSIHRIGELDTAEEFQLFNVDSTPLESGKNYQLKMWVYADEVTSGTIQLVSSDRLKLSKKTTVVADAVDVTKLEKGKWQEITVDFTAKGKYLLIRTPGLNSLYFDDVVIYDYSGNVPVYGVSDDNSNDTNKETATDDTSYDSDIKTGESNAIVICLVVFVSATLLLALFVLLKRKLSKGDK